LLKVPGPSLRSESTGNLPGGSYTGNGIDQILLQSIGPSSLSDKLGITSDVTMHDRGVPYRVGLGPESIVVGDGQLADPAGTLTIEAGVTLLFSPEGTSNVSQLLVRAKDNGGVWQPQGVLIVAGTPAHPVTCTRVATAATSAFAPRCRAGTTAS
jgi:hypothetical protein